MAFSDLHYEALSQYPHVAKNNGVVAGEDIDFIYQFVKKTYSTSIDYKNKNTSSIIDTSKAIIGLPMKFSKYGEFPRAFVMQTGGFEISTSSWQEETHMTSYVNKKPQNYQNMHLNYIDLEFHEAVFPLSIIIYEVYNPGYVTEIWAQNSDESWHRLWNGQQQIVPLSSRKFSPPLNYRVSVFKTKMIRLKFKHSLWNYSTQLDAVKLVGTSKLLSLKNFKQLSVQLRLSNSLDSVNRKYSSHQDVYNKNVLTKSKRQSHCGFSALPEEIIIIILKNLDIKSLCRMSQVDKRFNELTKNSLLFTCLKLRNIRPMSQIINVYNIISYFKFRCKHLKQLDLTSSIISVKSFLIFLSNCGSSLTHLRLSNCPFVNNVVLYNISTICKNLRVLDLSELGACDNLDEFSYLEKLKFLENLNLEGTYIKEVEPLCKILQNNRRMRNLNLSGPILYWCDKPQNIEAVIIQLKNSCPELEKVNLLRGPITPRGIDALAGCKNLQKLNILWIFKYEENLMRLIDKPTVNKIFSSCPRLEEINYKNKKTWDELYKETRSLQ